MASHNSRLHILQVVGGMNRAGVETWLMHVLRNIDRDRYVMDFLVHSEAVGAYEDEIRSLGGGIVRCTDTSNPLAYLHNFRRVIREHGPYDIVHSHIHHYSGFVMKLAYEAGIPVRIVHSHCDTAVTQSGAGLLRNMYLKTARRWINRYATLGLAVSCDSARDLFGPQWESDPRWRIFRLGFDLSPFHSDVGAAATRAELGVPPSAFVVGHVGRFDEQKNHAFMVDIASELIRRQPDTYLLLVGEGQLRTTIERKLSEAGISGHVLLLGSRPDVPRLMRGAMDVFLFPSLFEGLPVVLIEAQAAGLPCVVSDVITDEGDVVSPLIRKLPLSQSPSDWAEAVLRAGCDSTATISQQQALRLMEQSPFDIRVSLAELEKVYREACYGQCRR